MTVLVADNAAFSAFVDVFSIIFCSAKLSAEVEKFAGCSICNIVALSIISSYFVACKICIFWKSVSAHLSRFSLASTVSLLSCVYLIDVVRVSRKPVFLVNDIQVDCK